jgi:hypothetical protein
MLSGSAMTSGSAPVFVEATVNQVVSNRSVKRRDAIWFQVTE